VVFYLLFDPWTILAVSTLKMLQDLTNSSSIGSVQRFLWGRRESSFKWFKITWYFRES